jgi:hypothetical protein
MEPLSQKIVRTSSSVRSVSILLIACPCLLAGCVTTDKWSEVAANRPTGIPCKVVATWNPQVVYTPNPVDGKRLPGFAGRVYLFGQEMNRTILGDGTMSVELFTEVVKGDQKKEVILEQWNFDKDTLKKLEKRDPVGWGYTVFLPWGTYKEDLNKVELRLHYIPPAKGAYPLHADSAPLTLNRNISFESTSRRDLLGDSQPVARK